MLKITLHYYYLHRGGLNWFIDLSVIFASYKHAYIHNIYNIHTWHTWHACHTYMHANILYPLTHNELTWHEFWCFEINQSQTRSLLLRSTTGAHLSTKSRSRQFHQIMFSPAISSSFEIESWYSHMLTSTSCRLRQTFQNSKILSRSRSTKKNISTRDWLKTKITSR